MTQYLTMTQIAHHIGRSLGTIIRWKHEGKLPPPDAVIGDRHDAWLPDTINKWAKTL